MPRLSPIARSLVALLLLGSSANAQRSAAAEPMPAATLDPQAAKLLALVREHLPQASTVSPAPSAPKRLQWTAVGSFHQTTGLVAALERELSGRCSERLSMHLQRGRPRHMLAVSGTLVSTRGGVPCASWSRLGAVLAALSSSHVRHAWTSGLLQDGDEIVIEGVAASAEDARELWGTLLEEKRVEVFQFSLVGTSTEAGEERPRYRLEGRLTE